mmetsp:Transcript_1444/g.2805  ORF Transcript_1444/g.2805 Transcript_1444/m.2805 type:complete len:230 (-) Transcript_1444:73-762(-)
MVSAFCALLQYCDTAWQEPTNRLNGNGTSEVSFIMWLGQVGANFEGPGETQIINGHKTRVVFSTPFWDPNVLLSAEEWFTRGFQGGFFYNEPFEQVNDLGVLHWDGRPRLVDELQNRTDMGDGFCVGVNAADEGYGGLYWLCQRLCDNLAFFRQFPRRSLRESDEPNCQWLEKSTGGRDHDMLCEWGFPENAPILSGAHSPQVLIKRIKQLLCKIDDNPTEWMKTQQDG